MRQPSSPLISEQSAKRSASELAPEAKLAFDKARALWGQDSGSVSALEVCSDPEQAVSLLDKVISCEPDYAEAYVRRGLAKSELRLKEEAFDDVSKGIRLHPTPDAYAYRALVSLRAGQVRAAQKDLEYSLSKEQKQHLAKNISGLLLLTLSNKAEACARFREGCSAGDCSFLEAAKADKTCF